MGGGVPPGGVILPNAPHGHYLLPRDSVYKAGLAHPRAAQEGGCDSRPEIGRKLVHALPGFGAQGEYRGLPGDTPGGFEHFAVVPGKVRLCKEHYGGGPAVPSKGEVALQALEVKILVQGLYGEDQVHIRRHSLLGAVPAVQPGKEAFAGERAHYLPVAGGGQGQHIVPGCGELLAPIIDVLLCLKNGVLLALGRNKLPAALKYRRDPGGQGRALLWD